MATVVGLFDSSLDADKAVNELTRQGFGDDVVRVITGENQQSNTEARERGGDSGLDATSGAATPLTHVGENFSLAGAISGAVGNLFRGVTFGTGNDLDLSDDEARFYSEALRHGGVLVAVETDDSRSGIVAELFSRMGGKTHRG